jgi:hypothetical protein
LTLLAGCDRVFGLDRPDAYVAPDDTLEAGCRLTVPLYPSADTFLVDEVSAHGGEDVLRIDDQQPALIKFYLTDAMLQADERIAAAVIHANVVTTGDGCQLGCRNCPPNNATTYRMYWMSTGWEQMTATSGIAAPGTPWNGSGASGPLDRSERVVEMPMPTPDPANRFAIDLVVPQVATDPTMNGIEAYPWLSPQRIAIQVRTDHPLAIGSSERGDGGSSCNDGLPQPQLTLTICPR